MIISSSSELKALREAGQILVSIVQRLKSAVEPGKNAAEIDELAKTLTQQEGMQIAFLGYQGFPGALCISVNDEVAHGVPSKDKVFQEGDIVSIDYGLIHKGLYTDHAITFALGNISVEKGALIEVTQEALEVGITTAKAGIRTGNVGFAIEEFIKSKGDFGIVRKLVGHGIGYSIHEDPKIPNFGIRGTGYLLNEGEVIAIEPMITLGGDDIVLARDNFTYKTVDGSLAAHFEKTIVVHENGAEIIT